jgi:alcohol dehydrogenase
MSASTFNVPPEIVFGAGASSEAPAHLNRIGARCALIVTDAYLRSTGLADHVARSLRLAGISADIFSAVQPDPTDRNVRDGLRAYGECGADSVVALGGGSAIDAAKVVSVLTANPEPMRQYMGYHAIPRPGAPLIAIPTTAGTGSEATRVAVITDTERQVKMMMLSVHLMPAAALVDYELSMSMPRPLTAHVGVDTLTHGIEAFVSRQASAMTDPIALSCVGLVAQHLPAAWLEPGNRTARQAMALAACQGGMAFSNSSVALVHGMSRPIGALFHVPHGLSNAVLLPAVTRFSIPGAVTRYAVVARAMGLATSGDDDERAAGQLVDGLEALNERLGVPRLRECAGVLWEVFEAALPKMAEDALASGSPQNNPVVPTAEQIIELYRQAW